MTTLLSVKKRTASRPWVCSIPKNESFVPLKGKVAIGATIPILMPTLPLVTLYWNSRALLPLEVKMEWPLP